MWEKVEAGSRLPTRPSKGLTGGYHGAQGSNHLDEKLEGSLREEGLKRNGGLGRQGPKEQRTRPWGEQACPACQAASGPPSALYPPPADQTGPGRGCSPREGPSQLCRPKPRGPAVCPWGRQTRLPAGSAPTFLPPALPCLAWTT